MKKHRKLKTGAQTGCGVLADTYLGFLIIGTANRITTSATAYYQSVSDFTTAERRIMILGERTDLNAAEIGVAADLDKAAASRALASLQDRGLVSIEQTRTRGRAARVTFSSKGHSIHQQLRKEIVWRDHQTFFLLTAAEKRQLRVLLIKAIKQVPNITMDRFNKTATGGSRASRRERQDKAVR